jgi:hypothetical protein
MLIITVHTLKHGSPTRGPSGSITLTAAKNRICLFSTKFTQLRLLGTAHMLFSHVRPANQLTITGVALCHKKFGDP